MSQILVTMTERHYKRARALEREGGEVAGPMGKGQLIGDPGRQINAVFSPSHVMLWNEPSDNEESILKGDGERVRSTCMD